MVNEAAREPRVNGGNGEWTSLKAWANAIGVVGIPGAIALFVVYLGATQLPKLVTAVETAIVEVRRTQDLIREHSMQTDKLIWVARQTCWNAAKDDDARRKCYD